MATLHIIARREGAGWTANALVPMRDGRTLKVTARASYSDAAARAPASVGALSLRDIGRWAKRQAKALAKSKAIKLLGRIANSPTFKALLPPQLTMALGAVKAAARAIRGVQRGSRAAMRAIRAAQSNPAAAAALRIARAAVGPATQARCSCPA